MNPLTERYNALRAEWQARNAGGGAMPMWSGGWGGDARTSQPMMDPTMVGTSAAMPRPTPQGGVLPAGPAQGQPMPGMPVQSAGPAVRPAPFPGMPVQSPAPPARPTPFPGMPVQSQPMGSAVAQVRTTKPGAVQRYGLKM